MSKSVNDMSEEEFEAEFEKMMGEPADEESEPIVDDENKDVEVDQNENEVDEDDDEAVDEVDEAEESDDSQDEDIEQPESDEAEDDTTDTSTDQDDTDSKEQEPKVEPFNFDSIPMDEVLPMDIPVNGTKVRATMNELMKGFKQGMNYTQKMQELAPVRKSVNIITENNISEEMLKTLVDITKGDASAAAKLLKDSGIDSLDADEDKASDYTPGDYGSEPESFAMEQVKQEITDDAANFPKVQGALNSMQDNFFNEIVGDPINLRALHKDINSGVYDVVKPEMDKLVSVYGEIPSIELYKKAVANVMSRQPREAPRQEAPKVDPAQEEARLKRVKAAGSGTKRKTPVKETFVDFDDLDDDAFEAEFQKMTGRAIKEYK